MWQVGFPGVSFGVLAEASHLPWQERVPRAEGRQGGFWVSVSDGSLIEWVHCACGAPRCQCICRLGLSQNDGPFKLGGFLLVSLSTFKSVPSKRQQKRVATAGCKWVCLSMPELLN